MQTVELHDGAIKTSRLGLGTASLHHLFSSRDRQNLLSCAWDHGISYFDTAPLYGHGLAERELGKFAKSRRARTVLVTKFGLWPRAIYQASIALYYMRMAAARLPGAPRIELPRRDFDPKLLFRSVDRSLQRLRTDHIDVLLLHEPSIQDLRDPAALASALAALESSGKIRSFGLSANVDSIIDIHRVCPALLKFVQVWWRPKQPLSTLASIEKIPDASFGHFRTADAGGPSMRTKDGRRALLAQAVAENPSGVVLFSTRSRAHLVETVVDFAGLQNDR